MKNSKIVKMILIFVFMMMLCVSFPNISNAKNEKNVPTKNVNMMINKKKQLMTENYKNYTWSTSNKKIATVSKKSVVTAKKEGKVKITRKHKKTGKKKIYNITIKSDKLKSIQVLFQHQKHWVGGKYDVTIKKQPANNKELIYWKSSNSNIAEVINNKIVMKSQGRVALTAYSKQTNVQATIWVTAYNSPKMNFQEKTVVRQEIKSSKQLNLNCKDYPKSNIKYKSNYPKIINVDNNGKITALRPGSAIITATALDRTRDKD